MGSNTSFKLTNHTLYLFYINSTMSYKTLFIFGLLVAAAWTKPLLNQDLPEDKVLSEEEVLPSADATANVKVDFGDLKCDDDNVEKVEKVVKTENGVSAIASVKVKAPMMKFVFGNLKCDDENAKEVVDNKVVDEQAAKNENEAPACVTVKKIDAEEMKKFMEEFNKKWEELKKKIEENKNSEKCETVEANSDDESADIQKTPFKVFKFRVCSRASAKATSTACSNEEAQPAKDEILVAGPNGPIAVKAPVAAEPAVVEADEPASAEPVKVAKPVEDFLPVDVEAQ